MRLRACKPLSATLKKYYRPGADKKSKPICARGCPSVSIVVQYAIGSVTVGIGGVDSLRHNTDTGTGFSHALFAGFLVLKNTKKIGQVEFDLLYLHKYFCNFSSILMEKIKVQSVGKPETRIRVMP